MRWKDLVRGSPAPTSLTVYGPLTGITVQPLLAQATAAAIATTAPSRLVVVMAAPVP
ncbi:hypothetical protein GCM10022419_000900 [Nonomuraea rosea]|uniref:Uncharacterized protein n=1 Tax=Nonomuraea rosea TaxID=638574 RepID=A0ABP6V302_9ACTN